MMPALIIAQDFANIFKAFIGTNYLTVSFAFKESGLLLGLIGIAFIVTATAHCCRLIVKCKKDVVHRILTNPESLRGSVTPALLRSPEGELEQIITYEDVAGAALGAIGSWVTLAGLFITQFGFCLGYFVFIADTIQKSLDSVFLNDSSTDHSKGFFEAGPDPDDEVHVVDYKLLLLIPLPFFLIFSMLRRIRQMGPISAVANILVAIGFVSITVVILTDFEIADDINWYYNLTGFPVFFGQVTASYEGIGTIIPIESSMVGNRELYPTLLYSAILTFTVIYCFMGILGYLRFGSNVAQGLVWSLTHHHDVVPLLINIAIAISVLLTYPLQNFVTIQIIEGAIWGKAVLEEDEVHEGTTEERRPLLSSGVPNGAVSDGNVQHNSSKTNGQQGTSDVVVAVQSHRIRFWKRALVRAFVVLVQFGLAVFLKDDYAYVSALVGATGCVLLQYILPCLIHLALKWHSLPVMIIIKDFLLMAVGVVTMISGVILTLMSIVEGS